MTFVFSPISICADEAVRLEVLREYDILDTPPESSFDNITRLARLLLATPMASISLIDENRQWLKSRQGIDFAQSPRSTSFCAQAIESAGPLVVCDAATDHRFYENPFVVGAPHIRFYAGVPLTTTANANLGTLCVLDTVPRPNGVSDEHLDALYALGRMTVDALELRRLAAFDSLTDLLTHGAFRHAARNEFERALDDDRPLSCIVLDIDHFKAISDTRGQAIGDAVLRSVAKTLRANIRSRDLLCRIGGEEFALLLPDTTADAAMRCAERIRSSLANTRVTVGGDMLSVTASLGVAAYGLSDPDMATVMARADQALYQSKAAGRNRVSYMAAAGPSANVTAA